MADILREWRRSARRERQLRFPLAAAVLILAYIPAWIQLVRFSLANEFNSYVIMVPPVAIALFWASPRPRPEPRSNSAKLAWPALLVGISLLGGSFLLPRTGAGRVTATTLSFVAFLYAEGAFLLARDTFARLSFPILLLSCMAPLPPGAVAVTERLLQHASAWLAFILFRFSDLPVLRIGDVNLQLPGITFSVAPACSGIQSTFALFFLSLAAGYVFIHSPWLRALLTLAIVPLGILRNAIRIVTVGELCSHYGPQMIDSYIHRKGGWIFFLVFLVPFFALLATLMRLDRPSAALAK